MKTVEEVRAFVETKLEQVRKEIYLCSLGDRPQSPGVAKLARESLLAEILDELPSPAVTPGEPPMSKPDELKWGDTVRVFSDDPDLHAQDPRGGGRNNELHLFPGECGDWYLAIGPVGFKVSPHYVRLSTSGGVSQRNPGFTSGIADAYRSQLKQGKSIAAQGERALLWLAHLAVSTNPEVRAAAEKALEHVTREEVPGP